MNQALRTTTTPIPLKDRKAIAIMWGYRIFPVLLLPIMLVASLDFGVTRDEGARQVYGEAVVRYFTSGFADRSALRETSFLPYGGLFDVICVTFQTWLPTNDYVVRHLVNAAFGFLGVVFCGRIACRLAGPGTGLLAMTLLALSPRYFAESMNNPKDLPFAALTTIALYFLMCVETRPPYLTWRLVAKLAFAIALAINVRVGGILYICYLGLFVGALILTTGDRPTTGLWHVAVRVGTVAAAALVLGTVFWPWAQQQPFIRPFLALANLSKYEWSGGVLFRGACIHLPGCRRRTSPGISSSPLRRLSSRGRHSHCGSCIAGLIFGGRCRCSGSSPFSRSPTSSWCDRLCITACVIFSLCIHR